MGAGDAVFDEAPVHAVELSSYRIDQTEMRVDTFLEIALGADALQRIEGPWFRYSVAGALAVVRDIEGRVGAQVLEGEGGGAHEADRARWTAAWAALDVALGDPAAARDASALARHEVFIQRAEAEAGLPVRGVTWHDAAFACATQDKRLPTEAEWERAARGPDGRRWPWGDTWEADRCAVATDGPAVVGSHPACVSPVGALDMAGNVWEWVADWYGEVWYAESGAVAPTGPEGLADGRLPTPDRTRHALRDVRQGREDDTRKVIRGGGFGGGVAHGKFNSRTTRRLWSNPTHSHADVGFRCAADGAS